MVFASTDHRGHKGAVRYTTSYCLYYRFGFAVMTPSQPPVLVLPDNFRDAARSDWEVEHRFAGHPADALADMLATVPGNTIGIVGLRDAMRAADYLHLAARLPGKRLVDAEDAFEQVRARKSEEEIAGIEDAADIADACFGRLLSLVRDGITERALEAQIQAFCTGLGAGDTLFLVMGMQGEADAIRPFMGPPRDLPITAGRPLMFSIELTGPSGYWTEFCRTVVIGDAAPANMAASQACARGIAAAAEALVPGARMADVYARAQAAVGDAHLMGAAIGHSIGLDVVERPLIALGAAGSIDAGADTAMAFAVHPRIKSPSGAVHAYAADTLVLRNGQARALSRWPHEIYTRGSTP